MPSHPSNSSERRRDRRISGTFAIGLNSEQKRDRLGVTRDISEHGLLVVTPSRFASGEKIALRVWVGGQEVETEGHVARVAEHTKESPEVWRYRLAIELDEPLPAEVLDYAEHNAA